MAWWQMVLMAATPCVCGFIGGYLYARQFAEEIYEEGYSLGWDDSVIALNDLAKTRKQAFVVSSIRHTAGIIFEKRKKAETFPDEE